MSQCMLSCAPVSAQQQAAADAFSLMLCHADAPEMAELGLIKPLGNILSQLSQGGGAKGINIDAVSTLFCSPVKADLTAHSLLAMRLSSLL